MMFDPVYWLFALPALLLSVFAQIYVQSRFSKYSKIRARSGLTGAEAAARMLQAAGVYDVRIERVRGFLSDHYDPSSNTLRLSDAVYGSNSLAAVGVACHEAGHALQKASNYAPMGLRSLLVVPASIGSRFSYLVIILGALMQSAMMIQVGVLLFTLAVLFTVVTLPVEWNASSRAKEALVNARIVSDDEVSHAGSVLNAAFLTYVAAAASSISTLLYYLMRLGLLGGRRR